MPVARPPSAIVAAPPFGPAYLGLADLYVRQERLGEALLMYEAAVRSGEFVPSFVLANLRRRLGR